MFWIVEVVMEDNTKKQVNVFAGDRDTAILRAGQMAGGSPYAHFDKVWNVYPWLDGEGNAQTL